MALRALLGVVASFLLCGASAAENGADRAPDESSPPLRDFASWTLHPRGIAAVYVLEATRGGTATFLHQDLQTRAITEAPTRIPAGARPLDMRPTWSPDGSKIAYFLPAGSSWHLHIWRPADGAHHVFAEREACVSRNEGGCRYGRIEWSPDSRFVYFLAQPRDARGAEAHSPAIAADSPIPLWKRALFSDPDHGGITVLESTRAKSQQAESTFMPAGDPADALVADTRTLTLRTILAGRNLVRIALSPDGRRLLAIARIGRESLFHQTYGDYYVVPVDGWADRQIKPLLHRVLQTWPAAWSPDSRTIAFAENGALAPGDIHLIDVETGKTRNVTRDLIFSESGEQFQDLAQTNRHHSTPGKKLNDATRLLWSPAADAIYALRRTRSDDGWKVRLWKIASNGKSAVNLSAGAPFDVDLPLTSALRSRRDEPVIVPTRYPTGEAGFAALDPTGNRVKVLAKMPGDLQYTWQGELSEGERDLALFVSESPDAPPEAFLFKHSDDSITRVTSFNETVAKQQSLPRVHRVTWKTPAGKDGLGYLYKSKNDASTPLLVEIYPRSPSGRPMSGTAYAARPDLFRLPLSELVTQGYALFKPDIPVAGHGNTCDDLALNLNLALDAVDRAGLADTRKSILVGFSFGGWAVNCAITRTDRFRAAISIAGVSDLIGNAFSIVGNVPAWNIGGGQTMIGQDIWNALDLYWRESPISGARNVNTPLLLIHGKADENVPVLQATQMYVALSRLGKDVTLVTYDDTTHNSVSSHPDYASRVRNWIEEYVSSAVDN